MPHADRQASTAAQRHELQVMSAFASGYTAECSCGWRSEEMAFAGAALKKGREHQKEVGANGD